MLSLPFCPTRPGTCSVPRPMPPPQRHHARRGIPRPGMLPSARAALHRLPAPGVGAVAAECCPFAGVHVADSKPESITPPSAGSGRGGAPRPGAAAPSPPARRRAPGARPALAVGRGMCRARRRGDTREARSAGRSAKTQSAETWRATARGSSSIERDRTDGSAGTTRADRRGPTRAASWRGRQRARGSSLRSAAASGTPRVAPRRDALRSCAALDGPREQDAGDVAHAIRRTRPIPEHRDEPMSGRIAGSGTRAE